MASVTLVVEGVEVPLKASDLALVFRGPNWFQPDDAKGDSTRTFSLPNSAQTRSQLSLPARLNTQQSDYAKRAQIVLSGSGVLMDGILTISAVNDENIECVLYNSLSNWMDAIKGKTLRDLDLADLNYQNTTAVALASWTDWETRGWFVPILDYGQFRTRKPSSDIRVNQTPPAVFALTYLRRIFGEAGFALSGKPLTDPLLQRCFVPFVGPQWGLSAEEWAVIAPTVNSQVAFGDGWAGLQSTGADTLPFQGEFTPNSNASGCFDDITNIYTSIRDSNYNFSVRVFMSIIEGSAIVYVANSQLSSPVDLTQVYAFQQISTNGSIDYPFALSGTAALDVGETLGVFVEFTDFGGQSSLTAYQADEGENWFFSVLGTPEFGEGDDIPMSQSVPEMAQTDFVASIFGLFGITPITRGLNVELVYMNEALFAPPQDLTKYLVSGPFEVQQANNLASRLTYRMAEDENDIGLRNYQTAFNQQFGSKVIDFELAELGPQGPLPKGEPFTPIEVNFAPTVLGLTHRAYILAPVLHSTDGNFSLDFTPRLLVYAGLVNWTAVRLYNTPAAPNFRFGGATRTQYPWLQSIGVTRDAPNALDLTYFKQSPVFSDQNFLTNGFTEDTTGVFFRHQAFAEAWNKARAITVAMVVPPQVLTNLDLSKPVTFNAPEMGLGGRYFVQQIEWNAENDTANVTVLSL